jgi:hypothetical protein
MPFPVIDVLVMVVLFGIAAIAHISARRAAARETERVITHLTALTERIETIDERLSFIDGRLIELSRRVETPARAPAVTAPPPAPVPTPAAAGPSYPIAIRLARNGATCEQIMESCGIGRQEAELVKRLHGPSKRSSRNQHAAA